jgi:hypothetical protein
MSLTTIHEALADQLRAKTSLRGVVILSMDDREYWKTLGQALAQSNGVPDGDGSARRGGGAAIAIGNPSGIVDGPDVPGGRFRGTIRAHLFENQQLNRDRPVAATVADLAARLALTGVAAGALVHQTDTAADWWLMVAAGEASAANWAPLLVVTAILDLVIRSLQHFSVAPQKQVLVIQGFDPGGAEDLHDYVARFQCPIGLDSTPVP